MKHYTLQFTALTPSGCKTVMLTAESLGEAIERAIESDPELVAPRTATMHGHRHAITSNVTPLATARLNRGLRRLWELPQ